MGYSFINSRWYALRSRLALVFSAYWRYKPNRWYLLVGLLIQALIWFLANNIFKTLGNDLLVFHYNVDFGIDAIAQPRAIFQIPLFALAAMLLNGLMLTLFVKRIHFHFLANASGIASILIQLLAVLALMSLYLINFLA
ncbi:MAG: hypothetical protein PHE20_01105 [Patescibacteria group bacterium]|nr:hypothetical protein [Patescibacteria group bacterium]